MRILTKPITIRELKNTAEKMFGSFVKAVVDIERGTVAIDGELHVDLAELLVEQGAKNENLWGINIHPEQIGGNDWIEFDSMINLKPRLNNQTRGVENQEIREKIITVVKRFIAK